MAAVTKLIPGTSKVSIVGGGLAGAALSLSLARSGIHSDVYESRAERGDIGGALTVSPNAARVLDRLGVWDKVKSQGYTYDEFNFVSEDGVKLGTFLNGSVEHFGYQACRVRRSRLHSILLEAVESYPDMSKVHYGKRVIKVTQDEKGASVHFEGGDVVLSDLVIGSDGLHSVVRRFLLGDEAPEPKYEGLVSLGGPTSIKNLRGDNGDRLPAPCMLYGKRGTIGFVPYGSEGEDIASWFVTMTIEEDKSREEWSRWFESGEAFDAAMEQMKGWKGPVLGIIADAKKDPEGCRIWPQYAVGDIPKWHEGRIVLIGDAAHAIPPSGGQGAGQAFEDVELLSRTIVHGHPLANWETERRRRLEIITKFTSTSGATRKRVKDPSNLAWWVSKTLMRAYFKFSGLGMAKDIYAYDGSEVDLS